MFKTARSALLVLPLLIACTANRSTPSTEQQGHEVLSNGQINGNGLPNKTVVFTYDDGPDEHTLELAQYLNENGVRATFFVNGRRFCKTIAADGTCTAPPETRTCAGPGQASVAAPKYYPESVLDQLTALGHRIGNHTQDHCHLPRQTSAEEMAWQVKATQDILDRHICDNVFLFRAPYGEWNAATAERANTAVGANKITGPINWDVDGGDWDCWQKKASPESCANKYFDILAGRPKQNGVFLMHDRPEFNVGYEGPLLMTKILVPRLKAAGYKFGTIDDVLKLAPSTADAGCAPPVTSMDAAPSVDAETKPEVPSEPADAKPPGKDSSPAPTDPGPSSGGAPGTSASGGASGGGSGGSGPRGQSGGQAGRAQDPPVEPTPSSGCQYAAATDPPGAASAAALALLLLALALSDRQRKRPR